MSIYVCMYISYRSANLRCMQRYTTDVDSTWLPNPCGALQGRTCSKTRPTISLWGSLNDRQLTYHCLISSITSSFPFLKVLASISS